MSLKRSLRKRLDRTSPITSITPYLLLMKHYLSIWRRSDARKKLISDLHAHRPQSEDRCFKNAICFATGSWTERDKNKYCGCHKHGISFMQMAIFLDLVRHFESQQKGVAIGMAAQDPAYTDLDKALLKRWKVVVLQDPDDLVSSGGREAIEAAKHRAA